MSKFEMVKCYVEFVRDYSSSVALYSIQRRAKSIRSLIFYYIFHVKPHFLKTFFQSRFLFDFNNLFTNKNRIKCSFTLILA